MIANPTLATECAEMILRIAEGDATGIFHCTGTEAVSRLDYAQMVARGFGFDVGSVTAASVDFRKVGPDRCPVDTSLDNTFTRRRLAFEPSNVTAAIATLRSQREAASHEDWLAARARTVTS